MQNYENFEAVASSSSTAPVADEKGGNHEQQHHVRHSYIRLKPFVVCCLPKTWHFTLLKILYSASYVIGCLDITFMYMLFYFLLNVAKLTPITVGIMMFFGGTFCFSVIIIRVDFWILVCV